MKLREAKKEAFVKPHEVFESVCKKNPKLSAVERKWCCFQYEMILNKANKIAETLQSMDIVKGSVVAIFVKRRVNVYISMLGILRAAMFIRTDRYGLSANTCIIYTAKLWCCSYYTRNGRAVFLY